LTKIKALLTSQQTIQPFFAHKLVNPINKSACVWRAGANRLRAPILSGGDYPQYVQR